MERSISPDERRNVIQDSMIGQKAVGVGESRRNCRRTKMAPDIPPNAALLLLTCTPFRWAKSLEVRIRFHGAHGSSAVDTEAEQHAGPFELTDKFRAPFPRRVQLSHWFLIGSCSSARLMAALNGSSDAINFRA